MIKRIVVKNFKSFDKLDIKLNRLNIIIGGNASGKSNFIEIFKFLRDLEEGGLENAVSMQGGVDYFRNIKIGKSKIFNIKVICKVETNWDEIRIGNKNYFVDEIIYEFSLNFDSKKGKLNSLGYSIQKDVLDIFYKTAKKQEKYGSIKISNLRKGGLKVSSSDFSADDLRKKLPPKFNEFSRKVMKDKLIIESPQYLFSFGIMSFLFLFRRHKIFYFDTRLSRKAIPFTGKIELDEDGGNIAAVISNIQKDPEKEKKLLNLINNLLPFVDKISIDRILDKSILFKLKEKYSKDFLPAFCISDGSINVIALIIALYFTSNRGTTIIEEPERNIHPSLVSKIAEIFKDVSSQKQIIISTHSPELIKHFEELKNILFISRTKDGYSRIEKLSSKSEIKHFLKNEIGIDELFVQNFS